MKTLVGIIANCDNMQYNIKKDYIKRLNTNCVILPYENSDIGFLDGIILTGGGDFSEYATGEKPHESCTDIYRQRDEYELDVIKKAFCLKIPILGICRGMQAINLAFGGSIYQNITGHKSHNNLLSHNISLKKGSHIYNIFNKETICVNSFHHQAVCDVAKGFNITAFAEDNITEAIEYEAEEFILGVQWHPEKTGSEIFEYFTEKTKDYRRVKNGIIWC